MAVQYWTHLQRSVRYIIKKVHLSTKACVKPMELQEVVRRMEVYASPSLAEDWDNVGLLIQPTFPHIVRNMILTNDVTESVMDEAVSRKVDMILSYHPPIFAPMKRLTGDAWKARLVIRAIENRVAVYSPHTAYDVVKGGVNDWLISSFVGHVEPIKPNVQDPMSGIGRITKLSVPLSLNQVIKQLKEFLGLDHVRVACTGNGLDQQISTIASCAGSGGSLLCGVHADLFLTGEMSHHQILDAVSNAISVVLCEHSNTERGFLRGHADTLREMLDCKVNVFVSEVDRDPIEIV